MHILITGGAGFIGTKLTLAILDQTDHFITVVDKLIAQVHGMDAVFHNPDENRVHFIHGDICDLSLMRSVVAKADYIFHLAAETGTGQSMSEVIRYDRSNVGGTSTIIEATQLEGVRPYMVLASSRSVYGEGSYQCDSCGAVFSPSARPAVDMDAGIWGHKCIHCDGRRTNSIPTTEAAITTPVSLYAATKLAQENYILLYRNAAMLKTTVFRFQNVYGPGQSLINPYTGILSIFSSAMRENSDINIFEDGEESRDFVYIDDIVTCLMATLSNAQDLEGKIFNLGSGVPTTIATVASLLKQQFCSKSELIVSGEYRLGDIRHNYACMKYSHSFGLRCDTPLETGIGKFTDWVESSL